MTGRAAIGEAAEGVALVDHHVHGCWVDTPDRHRFENALNEGNTAPLAPFDSAFDSQIGFAVRAHCAPLLDLPRHASPDDYWARRTALGEAEVGARFLRAAGVSHWLLDTGLPDGITDPAAHAALSGGAAAEIVRLEQVAEQAAADPRGYVAAFDDLLARRARAAVGTKSVLAYRGGFAGALDAPSDAEAERAAERWRAAGGRRLTDRVLLRFGLHRALALGKPLQLHVGFGDRDADLALADPLLLRELVLAAGDVPVMLLHCYPFERQAGYLASAYNNVFVDVGLSVNHLGARAGALLTRLLELAPFRKVLYSSDGFGPAELHYLGARLWRLGMGAAVTRFVDAGEWSAADAARVVGLVGRDNALRVYGL